MARQHIPPIFLPTHTRQEVDVERIGEVAVSGYTRRSSSNNDGEGEETKTKELDRAGATWGR